MACEVTYKGTKYSRNEFIELLYNGELDKLMPKLDQRYFVGTYAPEVKKYNPLQDVESTAKALEGVSKDRIESVLDGKLIHHGTGSDFDILDEKKQNTATGHGDFGKGFYFSLHKGNARYYSLKFDKSTRKVKSFLFDIANPFEINITNEVFNNNTKDALKKLKGIYSYEIDIILNNIDKEFGYKAITKGIGDSRFSDILKTNGFDAAWVNRTLGGYTQNGAEIVVFDKSKVFELTNKSIAEAYHKAKEDGTNPELVKAVEELLKETPQAGSVLGGDVDLTMVEYTQRYPKTHEVVFVDPSKVLERLAKDDPNYDVQNKKNQIGNRVQKAKDFILNYAKDRRWINPKTGVRSESTNAIFEPSIAQINNGKISFEDGRHRILAAKELGITKVAIEVPKEQVNQFKKDFEAVKEIDSVNKAEQRLKDAWNNFKNSGIAADKFEEIKREVELVKALFDYAWKKGLQTAKDVYDYVVGAISGISDTQAKRLSNKVEGLLNNPSGLVDEVLDMYAPIVAEQGLELSDVKQFMDDTFYKGGKFDAKAASEWLKNETADIDEQEKRLWTDLISAATQQENTIGTPRPQPQAPPQQAAPQPQATTETQNIEWLNSLLGSSVTKENFPVILFDEKNEGGVEKKRISAGTQEEVFERKIEEDASYISVTIQTLGEIAQDDAKAALDKFGKNWIGTILSAFESGKMNMSTMVRAIGLLSYISNDLNNKITSGTSSRAELDALLALQRRADALSIKFSSWASLGLNARRILRKFAMGEIAMNDLSARVIGADVAKMVESVERIMQEQESNEDLNAATAPIPKARKKRSVVNRVVSAIKPKSGKKASAPKATAQDRQNIINDAIAEKRKQGMEGVSRQDLLNSIRERINKCK